MNAKKERIALEKHFEQLHDNPPAFFRNSGYNLNCRAHDAIVSAMVEAGEPYDSREARAEARKRAFASLDGKSITFENIVFMQGDDAREPLRLLNHESERAALDYLLQWDTSEGKEVTSGAPWGERDHAWGMGDLIVSYNSCLGYIGLCRVIVR